MFKELETELRSLFKERGLSPTSMDMLNPNPYSFWAVPVSGYNIRIDRNSGCMFVSLRDNTRGRELLDKIEASIKSYNLCYEEESDGYDGHLRVFNIYAQRSNQNCSGKTNLCNYSDNDVLVYAMNNIQCKMYILEAYSSYPRYNISLYQVVYGLCNAKKISLTKWEVTLNGHVIEPDIYAIGYNVRNAFSKKYTFEVIDGHLMLSPSYAIERTLVDMNRGKYNF